MLSLLFITSFVLSSSLQAYSEHSGSCSQLRVIFSFYASTIVPALDAVDKVTDTIISKLLPYVQRVKTDLPNTQNLVRSAEMMECKESQVF